MQPLGTWLFAILVLLLGYSVLENVAPQYTFMFTAMTLLGVGIFYVKNKGTTP